MMAGHGKSQSTRAPLRPVFIAAASILATLLVLLTLTPVRQAVMKTLGFTDTRILIMVLSESVLLAVVSGSIGLFLAAGFVGSFEASVNQFLPGLTLTRETIMLGLGFTVILGVVTGIFPALSAMRLNVVQALARR